MKCEKKVYLKSFGCQMNSRDSEVVKGLLLAKGYKLIDNVQKADVVLFNTCSVRQHAEDRVWSAIGSIKSKKSLSHLPVIGILGCMAQNYKEKIFKRAPQVDFVVGPAEIDKVSEIIEQALKSQRAVESKMVKTGNEKRPEKIYHTGFREDRNHAYIVISEGCDNYCSYCVVPYVRGRLRHRKLEEIVKEAKQAVVSGINNITLLGQNVNSYISDDRKINFVKLLKKISEIKGLKNLSFLTSHPKDTTRELFELMAQTPVIKKELHMPLQSGSDRILKKMNRGYTAKKYLELLDLYRKLVYNGTISTDIIIGFPSESDKDFQATFDLAKKIKFDAAYIFKYSPRPNTKAAKLRDSVPEDIKSKRHTQVLKLQQILSKEERTEHGRAGKTKK